MKKLILITLLLTLVWLLCAEQYTVNANQNEVRVLSTGSQQTVLEMTLGHFEREAVSINGNTYWTLNLKKEGITEEKGLPEVPYINRSLIIPATARMQLALQASEYTDIVLPVAPSKGIITRDILPSSVPYSFDSFYQGKGFYPTELTTLSEPFIIRDYRGITVSFRPFIYYPETRTLRVYTRIRVAVNNTGTDTVNTFTSERNSQSPWFTDIYKGLFLNYAQAKYPVLDEHGRILVITNSMFNTSIQPYVDWKRQKGFIVDVVDVNTAGPSAAQIQTYIHNQYNLNTDLAFVQLMGDAAQVPSLSSGGGGADPMYSLITADNYPDLFVGRFSATTTTDMDTQIQRTVYYERDIQAGSAWLAKGMGIASMYGGSGQGDNNESDQVHIEHIRTDLLGHGYTTVDQIYETQGATIAQISTDLYLGRGYIDPVVTMPVMLGVLVGASLGARRLAAARTRVVRMLFGAVVGVLAAEMIYHGLKGALK